MFQNNETAAILVFQRKPVGVGLFSCVKNFLRSLIFIDAGHVSEYALKHIGSPSRVNAVKARHSEHARVLLARAKRSIFLLQAILYIIAYTLAHQHTS